ncbi:MAG: hypothetical protein CHACPFDD_00969 [Phycisphaerae bacterium]|nr:hypothetical protein [Phycisphaerae bacterium]
MSERDPSESAPELLDLYLGPISDSQRAELKARVAGDPALAREAEALASVFSALGMLRDDAAPPADLEAGIRARVRTAPLRLVRAADSELPSGMVVRVRSLRDVLAVAAMIVLFVGIGVPSVLRMRERGQRAGCSANLAQLGQGLAAYAAQFNDSLPFVGWNPTATWQAGAAPAARVVPNRRHVYPLLREGLVRDPSRFVCPSRWDAPMAITDIRARHDFAESRNVSYGYQNMAGVRPSPRSDPAQPIMSDDNPLFDDGRFLTLRSGAAANSRAHGGAGQNILTLGGRVIWSTTPDCGVGGDNIWTLSGVREYHGTEGPRSATDSHLIK